MLQDRERLITKFNLRDQDFYFLELIPLIEMIWADGKNQTAELKILYQYMIDYIAELDKLDAAPVVSIDDANSFLDRFAHQKPNADLIDALKALFLSSKHKLAHDKKQGIINFCLDIAAACTTHYPFALRDRISNEEKALLEKLYHQLTDVAA